MIELFVGWINGIWNTSLTDIYVHLKTPPQDFAGGIGWNIAVKIHDALGGIAYGLLLLFFLLSFFRTVSDIHNMTMQQVIGWILRFVVVKTLIDTSMLILGTLVDISIGANAIILENGVQFIGGEGLPPEIAEAVAGIADGGFWTNFLAFFQQIPMFFLFLILLVVVMICGIIMTVIVYLRFFKIFIYTAISPLPLSTFASSDTTEIGKHFLKSYAAVCLEICVIALAIVIFNALTMDNTLIFNSWTFSGFDDPNSEFWGTVMNWIFKMTLNAVLLVACVMGANKMIEKIIGV